MKTYKNNSKLITAYMEENNLSKTAFCKLCGISIQTLNRFLNNESVSVTSAVKVVLTMNIRFSQLIEAL